MVDTNILLDWLLDRDPVRTQKIDVLLANATDLHVTDLAIVELVYVLEKLYKLPRELVVSNVQKILDEPVLRSNYKMFQLALVNYGKRASLSFVDCCLLQYAKLQKALPLWTFDKKLISTAPDIAKSA